MRKAGRKENTIKDNRERFIRIATFRDSNGILQCKDINDPEQFKTALATIKWANSTKATTASSYTVYLKTIGKTWTPPKYIIQEKLYFIPTEQELDALIAASGHRMAALLQLLKETGMRIGEAYALKWIDIDTEHNTVSVNHPEKGSLPRILKISDRLKGMINNLYKDTEAPFSRKVTLHGLRVTFDEMRKRTAKRLNNPRLKQIHFHTFRHWKATTMYHKFRDSTIIRHTLGHRSAVMTDRYIHIVETLYHDDTDDWTSKVVQTGTPTTIKEIQDLANEGYQHFADADGYKIFRKRK
jgi:integrase